MTDYLAATVAMLGPAQNRYAERQHGTASTLISAYVCQPTTG
ncbi:hypothetical protein OG350_37970 [Streptomyces achromogenes]|uniref:Uncharacterized protein n=1 Tax=Streptomyces achromogenes TaxID=67255 RepID=A0ABZ1KDP5_STRAH